MIRSWALGAKRSAITGSVHTEPIADGSELLCGHIAPLVLHKLQAALFSCARCDLRTKCCSAGSFACLQLHKAEQNRPVMNEIVSVTPFNLGSSKAQVSRQTEGTLLAETIHVLLVDDERLSRLVVGNLLRKCQYRGESRDPRHDFASNLRSSHFVAYFAVTAVATGMEALEALRTNGAGTFQLVLTVRPRCCCTLRVL